MKMILFRSFNLDLWQLKFKLGFISCLFVISIIDKGLTVQFRYFLLIKNPSRSKLRKTWHALSLKLVYRRVADESDFTLKLEK